jgi:hypothetical protein
MALRIYFDIPAEYEQRARSALAEIAIRWGIPISRTLNNENCDLLYCSVRPSDIKDAVVWVHFDPTLYLPVTKCAVGKIDGLNYWSRQDAEAGKIDLIGGVWRLLALLDESQVSESDRNEHGIFNSTALPEPRRSVIEIPLVDEMAELLLLQLTRHLPLLYKAREARWPEGKKWVLLLTSDVDSINLGDWRELAFNFTKMVLRHNAAYGKMFWAGLKSFGRVNQNPYFAFKRWEEWLLPQNLPIAFFLFIQPIGVPRRLHDCRNSVDNQPIDWSLLQRLAASGIEFGLHPSIMTHESTDAFIAAKHRLEAHVGQKIDGLRHHYLALDWRNPSATFKRHVAAGFAYDATIAYRDTGGVRAGTCLPYQPFDSGVDQSIGLIEVPFCLMDGHLSELKSGSSLKSEIGITTDKAIEMLKRVCLRGGMVHLNWHQETFWNRGVLEHFHDRLRIIIEQMLLDEDCWKTTPREVAKHWICKYTKLIHW